MEIGPRRVLFSSDLRVYMDLPEPMVGYQSLEGTTGDGCTSKLGIAYGTLFFPEACTMFAPATRRASRLFIGKSTF